MFFKGRVFLLGMQDFQALEQGQSGIDHGGKLSGKNNDIPFLDLGLQKRNIFKQIFGLFPNSSRRYFPSDQNIANLIRLIASISPLTDRPLGFLPFHK